MSDRDFEAEARQEGWVPQEEFHGDPEKWVDAETFVKRGEEILPIVNAKNRKLSETVEGLQHTVEELKLGNKQFREFHEKKLAEERQKQDQLIQQLEQTRQKAIEDGDGKAFTEADNSLNELRAQQGDGKQTTDQDPRDDPNVKAWLDKNQWYEQDEELQAIADGLSTVLQKQRPDLVGKPEFLDELTDRVKKSVPHKFENPNRNRPGPEDTGTKGPQKQAKTWEDLPDEDRAVAERFIATIPGFTKEQYLADYEWE